MRVAVEAIRAVSRSEVPGIALGFAVIYVVFAPGLLTPDSAWMLAQAETGQINDWLGPIFTWLFRTFQINGSEWFAIATIAFLITASRILCRAFSRLVAGFLAGVLACLPPVIGWLSVLSRDVLFGIALLAAVLLATGPLPPPMIRRVARGTGLVFALTLAVCARQNAVLPVLGVATLAVFPLTVRSPRTTRLLVSGTIGIAVTGLMVIAQSVFIDHVVHAERTHPEQVTYVSDLAAMSFATGQPLVPTEVWYGSPDYDRLASVWIDRDGAAIYNVADPPIHTIYDDGAVSEIRNHWLRSITDDPWAYFRRRARLFEIQLFEIQDSVPYVSGMAAEFPGHVLARPNLVQSASNAQDAFWRMSGLRVWHVLAAALVALWYLRFSRNGYLALGLQVASWLTVISLVPTAPGAEYRFTWLPVTAGLLTVALAVGDRWLRRKSEASAQDEGMQRCSSTGTSDA